MNNTQHTISDEAKALLHYASNAQRPCADDSDAEYCSACARAWAAILIAGTY